MFQEEIASRVFLGNIAAKRDSRHPVRQKATPTAFRQSVWEVWVIACYGVRGDPFGSPWLRLQTSYRLLADEGNAIHEFNCRWNL